MKTLFSEACERNKVPILDILMDELIDSDTILEIGSGTGQHAIYFAQNMPHLSWQPSEVERSLNNITSVVNNSELKNLRAPILLDIGKTSPPDSSFSAIFTANTFHIMPWPIVIRTIELAYKILNSKGKCIVYGPFKVNGEYTSTSNKDFDEFLSQKNSTMGIRDLEIVKSEFSMRGFTNKPPIYMPANNLMLVFTKST